MGKLLYRYAASAARALSDSFKARMEGLGRALHVEPC
jgi:hypothetical protein